jgi:hypothetical protein
MQTPKLAPYKPAVSSLEEIMSILVREVSNFKVAYGRLFYHQLFGRPAEEEFDQDLGIDGLDKEPQIPLM